MDENNKFKLSKPNKDIKVSKKHSALCFIRKNKRKQIDFEWELPKMDEVIYILKKLKKDRTYRDIKLLNEYLTTNLEYFKKLRDETDPNQYEKTLYVLKYEEVKQGKNIVTYDEEGDKCYVLLEGKISLLKPIYNNETMTMRKYITYLKELDKRDPTTNTRQRLISKNNHIEADVLRLMKTDIYSISDDEKYNIFVENFEKLFEANEGFSFGEAALLHKQKRNATIRAEKLCKLIYIDKYDYNRVLKEIEKNRIDIEIKQFVKKFNFFSKWGYMNITRLFSLMTTIELFKGEYLYKQNEDSEFIYFCIDGTYEIYSLISFGWKSAFIKYITNSESNIFLGIDPNRRMSDLKLLRIIKEAKEKVPESPMMSSAFDSGKCNVGLIKKEDINELIIEKDRKFSDPFDVFRVNMNDLDSSGILGLEEAIEFKRRYNSIRVKSKIAILKKVKTVDFLKVLLSNQKDERNDELMINYICEKKKSLITKILLGFNYKKKMQMNKYIEEYKKCYNESNYNKPIRKNMISYINTLGTNPTDANKTRNFFSNKKCEIKNPININIYYDLLNVKKNATIDFSKSKRNSIKFNIFKMRSSSSINEQSIDRKNRNNYFTKEMKIEAPSTKFFSFSPNYNSQKNLQIKEELNNFGNNNETTLCSSHSNFKKNGSKNLINIKKNVIFSARMKDKNNKEIKSNKSYKSFKSNIMKYNKNKLYINTDKMPSFNIKKYKKNLYFKRGFLINEIKRLGIGPNIPLRKESMFLNNDDSTIDNNVYNIESDYSHTKAFSLENNARKRRNFFLKITGF